jgi:hypothetical protein
MRRYPIMLIVTDEGITMTFTADVEGREETFGLRTTGAIIEERAVKGLLKSARITMDILDRNSYEGGQAAPRVMPDTGNPCTISQERLDGTEEDGK